MSKGLDPPFAGLRLVRTDQIGIALGSPPGTAIETAIRLLETSLGVEPAFFVAEDER
jgi:hypothetical protein